MLVLVHGAGFGASCWGPMVDCLDQPAYAVDLPGRGKHPADITSMTADDFADSLVADIDGAGFDEVVLVGHSAAGQTLPRVVDRIPSRIRHLIYVSCVVPRHGQSSAEALELADVSDHFDESAQGGQVAKMPQNLARSLFCNDMNDDQTELTLRLLVPDNPRIHEQMDLTGLRHGIPQTWVKLTRDVIIPPLKQEEFVTNLGPAGSIEVIEVDAGHMAMISSPEALAHALGSVVS